MMLLALFVNYRWTPETLCPCWMRAAVALFAHSLTYAPDMLPYYDSAVK